MLRAAFRKGHFYFSVTKSEYIKYSRFTVPKQLLPNLL